MASSYPQAGTNAARILEFIQKNPGASVSAVHRGLGMNPSPTRACITALVKHGRLVDRPDSGGHHYYAKDPVL